jgi:hypothetical protein
MIVLRATSPAEAFPDWQGGYAWVDSALYSRLPEINSNEEATIMKKTIFLLVLMAVAQLAAQEKSNITVKSTEVNSGVVIVIATQALTPEQAKASFALHCNKGASSCKAPEPGSYIMVRLPKNWGMYDCANVDLYSSSADPATSQKVGEYCLIEK